MTYTGGVVWDSRKEASLELLLEKARPFPTESFRWEIGAGKGCLHSLLLIGAGCFDAAVRFLPCARCIRSRRLLAIGAMAHGVFRNGPWTESANLGAGTVDAVTFTQSRG